ncbi:MAG: ComEC/Rec2 family competence protein [Candidatus Daviesbacteria bacterium]|nr:ComEC/Rec2 family competence protein [Candidatus Daviesbacteria bacterium]
MTKLPVVLAIVLYLLIYLLRWQQGGWDLEMDLFKSQRIGLSNRISEILPSPQAELLSGILLGQNKNLPGQFKLALRDTSTLHIVVASGQNLSMVAGFFLSLAGLIRRRHAIALSLLAVVFYTLLTGAQVPVLRAAIMFGLASLATFFGRQKEGWWVLMVTAALMLLINPSWITDLSFQLSFLATFGVVVVAPICFRYLHKIPLLGQDLSVTLAAQLMVTPVIAANFHQVSLVSLITNALILWTIPFAMILGAIALLLSFVWGGLAWIVGLATSALLTYFIYIVQFFASLSFSWEYVGEQWVIVWVGYYMVMGGIMLLLRNVQTADSQGFKNSGRET